MVVFFDIDGTIVDDDTQIIPQSTVRAVEALGQAGHLPVVNTGRPFHHIDPRVRAMGFRAWICGCGMQVILDGEYLYRDYPSVEACRRATAMAKKCGLYQMCESETELFWNTELTHDQAPFQVEEAARLAAKGITGRHLNELGEGEGYLKFITNDGPSADRAAMMAAVAEDFDAIVRDGDMIEYMKKGNTKARGMQILLRHLGVDRRDTVAIGDSTNDLPMFALAGRTICMGGGMPEAKAAAHYITDTVLNDGIAKALHHLGLIGPLGHAMSLS